MLIDTTNGISVVHVKHAKGATPRLYKPLIFHWEDPFFWDILFSVYVFYGDILYFGGDNYVFIL